MASKKIAHKKPATKPARREKARPAEGFGRLGLLVEPYSTGMLGVSMTLDGQVASEADIVALEECVGRIRYFMSLRSRRHLDQPIPYVPTEDRQ